MTWLANLVPHPRSRLPLTFNSFFADFLPAALAYYVTAALVILPGTLAFRRALLPISLWLLFRAATLIDVGAACGGPEYDFMGYGLCVTMIAAGMRVTEWTFVQKPLRRVPIKEPDATRLNVDTSDSLNGITNGDANRLEAPGKSALSEQPPTLWGALWDACDLCFNLRGHGWNWAQGWYFPPETRSTSSTNAFIASTLASAIKQLLLFNLALSTVRSFSPATFGSPTGIGGTIFDLSLSPYLRYAQSSFITFVGGMAVCAVIQMAYDTLTVLCIPILRQSPSQWPPLFHSPWFSTSLADCWGKRWHQLFRGSFIGVGAKPLTFLIGRAGGIMGAFFWSAILHDFGMWGMGRGTEFYSVGGFFLAMGFGCILEALFKRATGIKVGGWAGWLWTMCWIMAWGNLMMDAWARRGLVGSKFIPEEYMPSQILLSYIYGRTT